MPEGKEDNRMGRQKRIGGAVSFQEVDTTADAPKIDLDKEYATMTDGKFSISVTSDEKDEKGEFKVLYTNKEEPFSYPQVDSFVNVLRHQGAKIDDTQIEFMNQALAGSEETGKAVQKVVKLYNDKLKADAKSSAYAALVNKYKPLEGEKKESAQARMVANAIKLGGVSKETAIEGLKNMGFLPKDYTVADFDSTPLRRTKSDSDSE